MSTPNQGICAILDIDGTILKHRGQISDIIKNEPELLPGVKEKFDEWAGNGTIVILVTGRRECLRELTERQLRSFGLSWSALVMNCSNFCRYLIVNDNKPKHTDLLTAQAFTVKRDEGLENLPI